MKKITNWQITIILFSTTLLFILASCQREVLSKNAKDTTEEIASSSSRSAPVIRAYRDSFVNQLMFVPDIAGGWTAPNPVPAWYPGLGNGNATHIGKAKMYFNQYASLGADGINTVAASVTLFFTAPLADAGYIQIPGSVSTIVFDDKGNSIWFHHTNITSVPVSPTRVNVSGTQDIIGGTGKFKDATGQVTLNAFFNPQNIQESSSWQNGWIRY